MMQTEDTRGPTRGVGWGKTITKKIRPTFTHPNHSHIWTFNTRHLRVVCAATEENYQPLGDLEHMDDADRLAEKEIISKVQDCYLHCFYVTVLLIFKDYSWNGYNGDRPDEWEETVIGEDTLHQCVYENQGDFALGSNRDGYFRDMVRKVCREGREEYDQLYAAMRARINEIHEDLSANVWDWSETTLGNYEGKHIETRWQAITGHEQED